MPSPAFPVDQLLHLDGVPSAVAVDQHPGEGDVASDLDGATGEGFRETRARGELGHAQPLACHQALLYDGLLAVFGCQSEHGPGQCLGPVPAGGGKGHEAERRRDRIGAAHRTELAVAMRFDLPQQGFERRAQMRLVEQNERIDTEEAGMVRTHSPRHAVAFEQQPGADHVDGPDHDGGLRGIFQPVPVVGESAAQRGDGEPCPRVEPQLRGQLAGHVRAQTFREPCRLIHDRPPVDDIDEPPRQAGAFGKGDQPQRHHRRLPQAGRDIHDPRRVGVQQTLQETRLPAKWAEPLAVVRGQSLENRGEATVTRHRVPAAV